MSASKCWCGDREPRAHFLPAREIKTPADIEHLGWVGNHFSDHERFDAVDKFVRAQTDRQVQRDVLAAMAHFGMGEPNECSDEELQIYLDLE